MEVPPQAILHWDRGALEAECDRATVVRGGVEAYLGRAVFSADGSIIVRVKLQREAGLVVASVTREGEGGTAAGERTVTGDAGCASLDEPLTLVVALLVDAPAPPSAAVEPEPQPTPNPAPSPPAPPAVDEPDEIPTAPSLERASVSPGHAAFLAIGSLAMGGLPSAAVGGGLVVTLKPKGFWGLGVQAEALAPQRKALGAGSLEASLLVVGAGLCPLQGVDGSAWWSACANFNLARLRIESHDLLGGTTRSEWIALPGPSARAAWVVGHGVMIGGGLSAAFPVSPDRYVYRDPEGEQKVAFEPSRLTITANLGVGVLLD